MFINSSVQFIGEVKFFTANCDKDYRITREVK